MENLERLLNAYNQAPEIYQAGRYWKNYEDKIISEIKNADMAQLRSGRHPIFSTFGFSEAVYNYHPQMPLHQKLSRQIIRKLFITGRAILPYSLKLTDIREMAFQNCLVQGQLAGLKSIADIEADTYGNPADIFYLKGRPYTMQFLTYYIRLCFVQFILQLKGDETIVELGSGSGFQVEVLKKVFPDLTILCFDLPAPLYLCQHYLSQVLSESAVVKSDQTLEATSLPEVIQPGKVHFLGNWQFPLLQNFKFDLFWNAASFGEMEPRIVQNYLNYVTTGNCSAIFLLQARNGKESSKNSGVEQPIRFSDYQAMLSGFTLKAESEAFEAHRRMSQSGGYFQAVWQNKLSTRTSN